MPQKINKKSNHFFTNLFNLDLGVHVSQFAISLRVSFSLIPDTCRTIFRYSRKKRKKNNTGSNSSQQTPLYLRSSGLIGVLVELFGKNPLISDGKGY